jgi:hypothetical protein
MESTGSGRDEKNSKKAVASKVADDTMMRNEGRFRHILRIGRCQGASEAKERNKLFQYG